MFIFNIHLVAKSMCVYVCINDLNCFSIFTIEQIRFEAHMEQKILLNISSFFACFIEIAAIHRNKYTNDECSIINFKILNAI